MLIVYDLFFLFFVILYLPYFIFKRKFHRGFLMRLGFLPKDMLSKLKNQKVIWLHAVSVGEAKVAKILYSYLKKDYPNYKIAVSTVTSTGNSVVKQFIQEDDLAFYLPLDLSFIIKKVIRAIKPILFISFETELWPNLISQLYRNKVWQILLNGRISDRSLRGYKMIRFLFKDIVSKFELLCMQTEKDKERIIFLGAPKDRVKVSGNMKFDIADHADLKKDYTDYRLKLGLKDEEQFLVAGSTHPGEEKIILRVYKNLLKEQPALRLLIAPRHIERAEEIEKLISNEGFASQRISKLSQTINSRRLTPIFILDTIGELAFLYNLATLVFIGGTFVKKGGHNILEPAFFDKAILFGPYMFNFQDISDLFLNRNAAIMVHSEEEFLIRIRFLLNNSFELEKLGKKAKLLLLESRGATERNLEFIKNLKFDLR